MRQRTARNPRDGKTLDNNKTMPNKIIKGKTFTEPIHSDEQLTSQATVGSFQADFLLCEADYLRIKSKPALQNWSHNIFLTAVGIGLLIIGKYLSKKYGYSAEILIGEWIACGVGLILSLILYGLGLILPNEKKRVMKQIAEHFSKAPRTKHIVRKDK